MKAPLPPRHSQARGGILQGGRAAGHCSPPGRSRRRTGSPPTGRACCGTASTSSSTLAPAPVVARVATLTPLLRPAPLRSLAREVAVAGALAAAGAPVVPPSDLLPPDPHRCAELELSFWRHVEVMPVAPSPGAVGAALAGLHDHPAALPVVGSPLDTPLDDLTRFLALGRAWGATPARLERLAARLEELRPRLGGEVVALHGDAHPGNLLATPDGWRSTDLEDTCSGPRAWDLACLRTTTRLDGRAAVDACPSAPADEELAP
jgi:aminoglycoside phosphotransferase (APT) family kinase protein